MSNRYQQFSLWGTLCPHTPSFNSKLQAYSWYLRVESIDDFFAAFSSRASARPALVPPKAEVCANIKLYMTGQRASDLTAKL